MRQGLSVGVDVSARELVVAIRRDDGGEELARFSNDAVGHLKLIRRVTKGGRSARVALESTGVYGLDLALALHRAPRVEVMVANPRAVKDFGDALLKRTKTDPEDAVVVLQYLERMPFEPWYPPSENALILRSLARRITAMTQMRTADKNRLHAAEFLAVACPMIRRDIEVNLRHLKRRIDSLAKLALAVVRSDVELNRKFDLLTSVKGIADASAVQILGELAVLPPEMTARQWVAQAGLDPRHHSSGTSVNKPARISKVGNQRIRAGLYMPALVATQHEPSIRAYSQRLLSRGKKPLQAIAAVMRRLLHCFHAMFRLNARFNPEKFARPIDFQESA